jgi:hypothetical protein
MSRFQKWFEVDVLGFKIMILCMFWLLFETLGNFLFNHLVTLITTKFKIVWARVLSAKVAMTFNLASCKLRRPVLIWNVGRFVNNTQE